MSTWDGIDEFNAVVKFGGFSAAARHLGVSTSYVSRQIDRLETRLGLRLLYRTTRKVRPTAAGLRFAKRCRELAEGLTEAMDEVRGEERDPKGEIRMTMGGRFSEQVVVPEILAFMRQYPHISIRLDLSARNVDLVEEGYDLAVRYGVMQDSSLAAQRLVGRQLCMAAAPAYLAARGTPTRAEELAQHDCLTGNTNFWRLRFSDGHRNLKVSGRFSAVNSADSLTAAALAGLGIIYTPRYYLAEYLEDGHLVPLLEPYWGEDIGTWLVYPDRKNLPSRVRLLIDHLKRELGGLTSV